MLETQQRLDQNLSLEYLQIIEGWQDLEERLKSGHGPIDLRFVKEEGREFSTRQEVLVALQSYIQEIPTDTEVGRRHINNCSAALMYGEALEGTTFQLRSYLATTAGMELVPHPESDIMRVSTSFGGHLADEGFAHNEVGWRRFKEAEELSKRKIISTVNHARRKLIPHVLEMVGKGNLPLDFETKIVREDKRWVSRIIG